MGYVKWRTKELILKRKWHNGFTKKVLTSKAEPQIDGIVLEIWKRVIDERTKGLKILKI
jgi:hypothetical protein